MPFCQPRLSEVRPYSSELSPEDPSLNIKIDGKQILRYDLTNSQCVYEGSVYIIAHNAAFLETLPPYCFVPRLPYEESSRVGRGEGRGYEEDGKTDDQFPFTSAYPQNELILQRQGPIKFDGLLTETQNGTNKGRVILTGDWT